MRSEIKILARLSIIWGIVINAAVVLNLSFALPLAAGGQYENFPAGIRFVYFFQMLWLFYELRVFKRLSGGKSVRPRWMVKVFIALGIIGFFLNAFSASPAEKWNAIPLAITTYAFWKLKD
ncbi:MAG: hypothetical protein RIR66_868 [Actinomycetota bacterium]|jgi:hypothetical protein